MGAFFILIIILNYRLKDFRLSLVISYIASTIIYTGKMYFFEIIPPGVFPKIMYPEGNVLFFTITPQNILSVLLALFMIRDIFLNGLKKLHLEVVDIFVFLYFLWPIISDITSSLRPDVSILFSLQSLLIFTAYVYVKSYVPDKIKKFIPILLAIIASQIIFESVISAQQFVFSSPTVKNMEALVNLDPEFFSNASDDTGFSYRPAGTFPHTNYMAMRMSFWLIAILPFLFKKRRSLYIYPFVIGITTLVLTLSRSAWIGFSLATLFCLFIIEKVRKIKPPLILSKNFMSLGVIAVILIFVFVMPRLESSLYTFTTGGGGLREKQVEDTVGLITQNPVFGVGTGMNVLAGLKTYSQGVFSKEALTVHNWYLLTAVESGIPSLLFFTAFLIYKIRKTLIFLMHGILEDVKFLTLGLMGGIVALLAVGMFQPTIDSGIILLSFAILGDKQNEKY